MKKHVLFPFYFFIFAATLQGQNRVLDFDGVDDYAQIPSGVFFSGNFTIEAKVYAQSYNTWARVMDFGNGPSNDNVWMGYDYNGGQMVMETWNAGQGGTRVLASEPLPLFQWVHVTATLNGTEAKIYYDCIEKGTDIVNPPTSIQRDSNFIAKSNWPDQLNNFILDELRIWNKALSPAEIAVFKDSILTGNETNLLALWDVNSPNADTLFDKSSGGAHGVIIGDPVKHILCGNGYFDDDEDGVCSDEDCDDSDPLNTGILDCAGVCNGGAVDQDNDGVCSTDDCNDNDPGLQFANCKSDCLAAVFDTSNLLLYLGFNDHVKGREGEVPSDTSQIVYTDGVLGKSLVHDWGTILRYPVSDNFNPNVGTIQFWIKPTWEGSSPNFSNIISVDGSFRIIRQDAQMKLIIKSEDSEIGQHADISTWMSNEWHNVAYTWNVSDSIRVFIDGRKVNSFAAIPADSIIFNLSKIDIGTYFGGGSPQSQFDELFIYDTVKSEAFIRTNFHRVFPIDYVSLVHEFDYDTISQLKLMETWKRKLFSIRSSCLGNHVIGGREVRWTSADTSIADIDTSGMLCGKNEGVVMVTGAIDTFSFTFEAIVEAPALPPEHIPVDPYLATPATGAIHEIPVLIIRFIPTDDGINLDVSKSPDFWTLNPKTINEVISDINKFDKRVKFMMEEGSRFRGYKDPSAVPAIGYRVVDIIQVYETTPPGVVDYNDMGDGLYLPGWHQIHERFDIAHYVNDLGVKEIWWWAGGFDSFYPSYDPNFHDLDDARGGAESNMSSALTGDISNSYRDPDDLPIYDYTYVNLGNNFRRTQAESAHVRGHHFEAVFSHVNWLQDGNVDLFWKKFVGQDEFGNWTMGRCGWTHMPPNTIDDYDYYNPALVSSDIEYWNPDGTGMTKDVSVDTWSNLPYSWNGEDKNLIPQLGESQWYIYWMQSFPGFNNQIRYEGDKKMTNWWDIWADWEGVINRNQGLHEPICQDNLVIPSPTLSGVYNALGPLNYAGDINEDGQVFFTSDTEINLNEETAVPEGALFHAEIMDCGTLVLPFREVNYKNKAIEVSLKPKRYHVCNRLR